MRKISVLDVTLRDGGCVNDFNFGQKYMEMILDAQEKAGIDVIELGYLDDVYGSEAGRTKFISEDCIYRNFLKSKKRDIAYVAMMDFGKFDVNNLKDRTSQRIDGIRLAFHKKDYLKAVLVGKEILNKGYKLYMQPMITMRYSDRELLDLIDVINVELSDIEALYIVDSFGEMRIPDLNRIWNIVDYNLKENISVGFHSHNNLQLSFSNAVEFIRISENRNIYIDSSIMGMGKGAGNLNTELLLQHLNLTKQYSYKLKYLLEVIDRVVNQLHGEYNWGYAPEYYLSAINGCSPTYASYFYDKHMLPIDLVNELLGRIDTNKKISFDRDYAEKVYEAFNEEKKVDDQIVLQKLQECIGNKKVLLIAPGKSILADKQKIEEHAKRTDIFSIGLNIHKEFDLDYILITRKEILQSVGDKDNVIATSNISPKDYINMNIVNYANWIIKKDKVYDSSFVVAMKLMDFCGVKDIFLAGFDGFTSDINGNYYDMSMRHMFKEKQVKEYNEFYRMLIDSYRQKGIKITFLTASKYEGD